MAFKPTKAQQDIIEHTEGPALVIAGPGSGKTFTLVERILHLLADKQIPPERLFVATFTEKAARELQDRITRALLERGLNVNLEEMYLGTFHSICLKLLEEYSEFTRLKKNFTVMDKFDQEYFFYQNLRMFRDKVSFEVILGKKELSVWETASRLCGWMNLISEETIDYQRLLEDKDGRLNALGQWYELYQELMEQENILDFSRIQADTVRLLDNESVRVELKSRIDYIMVDEYQDTNSVQEEIVFRLLNEKNNICVVGDDDQGIYRFRGATIRNILEFRDHFRSGECKRFDLVTNFRSEPEIIEFYNRWMDDTWNSFSWEEGENSFRFYKNIVPPPDKKSVGNAVFKIAGSVEDNDWREQVLAFLHHLKDEKHVQDWSQIAFLFYSVKNDRVKALLQYLEEHKIPVYSPRSDLFFERDEIKLIIGAFLFIFRLYEAVMEAKPYKDEKMDEYYIQCFEAFCQQFEKPDNKALCDWCNSKYDEIMSMTLGEKALDL